MAKTYISFFEPREKEGFGVVFPDLPGLVTMGDNYEETLRMAHEGLASHISFLQESGEIVPKPRSFEEIKRTWADWQEWQGHEFLTVPITLYSYANKPKRISIAIDGNLLDKLDRITDNRTAYINKLISNSLNLT